MRWWERFGAWVDSHQFPVDVAGTLLAALLMVPTASNILSDVDGPVSRYAITVAMVVPLAWRRTRPTLSAVAVFTVALGHLILGPTLILPADVLVLVALYSVTVHGPVWSYRIALALSLIHI